MNNKKMNKTILFSSLVAVLILSISGINNVSAELTPEEQDLQDKLGTQILRLKVDNQMLEMIDKISANAIISNNNKKIDKLFAQMDKLVPDLPLADLSEEYLEKTDAIMDELVASGLPIHMLNVNDSTGIFEIDVDIALTSENIDAEIMAIVGSDIPTEIRYTENTARLQGACDGQSGDCDPVIGGSFAEEDGIAQDCTLTIADVKSSTNVMITVHHCNTSHNDMWQSQKNGSGDELGSHHTHSSDSECDCDLYEVDDRDIDEDLLNWDGDNVSVAGRSDASTNDNIVIFGGTSGADFGTIVDTGVRKNIPGFGYMDELYKMDNIDNLVIGDSGSPVLRYSDMNFVGMNNAGSSSDYNYGHEWSFIESSLGL